MDGDADIRPNSMRTSEVRLGTRFAIFPQPPFVPGYEKPEILWLSPQLGKVTAGPSDDQIYVIDPAEVKPPYAFPNGPPYGGRRRARVEPGPDGHFDWVQPGNRDFLCA